MPRLQQSNTKATKGKKTNPYHFLCIPREVCEWKGWTKGDHIYVAIENGKVILIKHNRETNNVKRRRK